LKKINEFMKKCSSCGSDRVKQYGPYASAKPGIHLHDQITSAECRDCEYVEFQKYATHGVRIVTSHIVKEGRADDVQRVIVRFVSDEPDENRLIKEFYIWLTQVFVQDSLPLQTRAETNDFLRVAVLVADEQYHKAHQVPTHGGVDCRNAYGGCEIVTQPKKYNYPVKRNQV
jgi:hypothetical protein